MYGECLVGETGQKVLWKMLGLGAGGSVLLVGWLSILCGCSFEGCTGVFSGCGCEDWLGVLCGCGGHVLFESLLHVLWWWW